MTLRARLLLGYGYLVALLLLVAGSAMLGFLGLSERLQVSLDEGIRSAQTAASGPEAEALREQALLAAEEEAREAAIRSGTWLGFLVVVALVSLVFLSRALQRQILARLEDLGAGVGAMAVGKHRRLREMGGDELGLVARHVNSLLDRYEELEGRSRGRLAQERRLVLGLLAALGEEVALFDLSGSRLGGEADLGGADDEITDWIRDEGRRRAAAGGPVRREIPAEGGARIAVELLLASGERPAGWLARRS